MIIIIIIIVIDELTYRLGNGFRAIVGMDGWKKSGVPGIRPKIILFFNKIQTLAEERLYMEELQDPAGCCF